MEMQLEARWWARALGTTQSLRNIRFQRNTYTYSYLQRWRGHHNSGAEVRRVAVISTVSWLCERRV